jgi:hypothetical protein
MAETTTDPVTQKLLLEMAQELEDEAEEIESTDPDPS